MPTSLDELLPRPEATIRCAEHARSIAVDPGGTAIRADRVVLVAAPLPWPKPALDLPLVAPLRPLFAASSTPTRLLTTVGGEDDAMITTVVYDRSDDGTVERIYRVDGPEALQEWAAAVAESDFARTDEWLASPAGPAAPAVLICTQGSHDVCCGSEGVRFAAEVEEQLDVTVYRVSHTGGHRFAPTAMTMPDGRMWSDLDLDALRRILAEAGPVDDLIDRCRGWWGADVGRAQIAERAVFAAEGWSLNHDRREVAVPEADDAGARSCTVSTGSAVYDVVVADGRMVPTIACRQPGGLPAKQAMEYEVRSFSRR